MVHTFRRFLWLSLISTSSDTCGNLRTPTDTCGSTFLFFPFSVLESLATSRLLANSIIGPYTVPVGTAQRVFYRLVDPITP